MLIHAKKSLGQNFLVNPHILDKIVATAEVSKNDIILEVGPGTGNLTKKLAEKAGKVIAIEKDRQLIGPLKETFKNYPNVEIIEADVMAKAAFVWQRQPLPYKIVANIPYYITSNFLRMVFEEWPQPKLIVLTIQKEVARRIVVRPPYMNLLALSVQYYSEPEIIGYISRNNFRPVPKVDSAIIKLTPRSLASGEISRSKASGRSEEELFRLIKNGFSEKRKQLASVLAKKLKIPKEKIIDIFQKEGIAPTARAENLSLEQWHILSKYLNTSVT